MCSEDVARTALSPIAAGLVQVVEGGWAAYLAENIVRENRTTRANIVNDHMHSLMAKHVPQAPPTNSHRADKPLYSAGEITIRLKYLKGKRPSNIKTDAQSAIAEQQVIPGLEPAAPSQLVMEGLEAPPEPLPPYITVGYELDSTEAEVAAILAVKHDGDMLCWAIDLRELAQGVGGVPVAPVVPMAPAGPALPLIAAKSVGAEGGAGDPTPALPAMASEQGKTPVEGASRLAESS